jgi:hypothetical protein
VTRLQFGRRQTLGVIFGVVGLFLVGYVAPNLEKIDKGLTLEPPPDPVKLVVDPPVTVAAIGIVFVLIAVATFFERRSTRVASGALVLGTVLFIPLVPCSRSPSRRPARRTSCSSSSSPCASARRSRSERWLACGASGPAS